MGQMEKTPELGSEISPTTAVIEAIADHEGLDPLDIKQPLHEVIDPDALNSIIGGNEMDRERSDIVVQFSYNGCRVHVSSSGAVEVSSRTD